MKKLQVEDESKSCKSSDADETDMVDDLPSQSTFNQKKKMQVIKQKTFDPRILRPQSTIQTGMAKIFNQQQDNLKKVDRAPTSISFNTNMSVMKVGAPSGLSFLQRSTLSKNYSDELTSQLSMSQNVKDYIQKKLRQAEVAFDV